MGLDIYYKFILAFAIILLAARIGGEIAQRYLKQPAVLGELAAGMVISPFALGGLLHDPIILNLAILRGAFGLYEFSPLEIISEIAVISLLFVAGVETDVKSFLKNSLSGSAVAFGGAILPFIFGLLVTMALYHDLGLAGWLFMGATLTATSIGVTVRMLIDMGRLTTKPGIIILVAAVVDDMIGIVILSIVLSMANTASLDMLNTSKILLISFGAWFALLITGVRWNRYISSYLLAPFRKSGTLPIAALLIGFFVSYLVTLINLHPVVGAYLAGLIFAATAEKEEILEMTRPIMLFLAPFFFCYLGMQVQIPLLWAGATLAVALIAVAILGKIVGCYIPAKLVAKLGHRDAMIVGVGMVPRGEVGFIIAGVGLLAGAITRELFGVAVAVSIVTTLITPAMLKPFTKRKSVTVPTSKDISPDK
ncbi:MAG TPA: cation:proton antiporter [Dehalococcoidia bacterium]|nr:cation:proton antiporter [Dehalococcoidia bacterium]